MKAYTDIEQSKRLIKLGIDVDSADMCYCPIMDIEYGNNTGYLDRPDCIPFSEVNNESFIVSYLPAWSLNALFKVVWKLDPDHILSFQYGEQKDLISDMVTLIEWLVNKSFNDKI